MRSAYRQQGVAFIFVIWVIALLAILLGSFSVLARTENLQARHLFDITTARYAAEAGVHRAAFELSNPDPMSRWVADGRPYEFTFEEADISVSITDDSGKIDINTADETILKGLFKSIGLDETKADQLTGAIQDWRDPDDLVHPNGAEESDYKSAGKPYKPKNAPFDTVSEIQQVLGMDYEVYRKLEPAITIFSGRSNLSAAYAPLEALMALPNMNEELARQLIAQRQSAPLSMLGMPAAGGLALPDGTPIMADGGGLTYSIQSRATLPNGASTMLDATIRMGGVTAGGRPFVIVRWRDKEGS